MEKDVFIPNGGLNQDTEEFFLPKGDYIDAKNIVIDSGVQGGSLAIKKIEGVANVDNYSGTIKAVTETKGVVYFVTRHGNTARLYQLKDNAISELLNYQHSILSADDFSPDIKVLGDVAVWNYYKGGTPLSWYFGGSRPGGNIPPERIRFAKRTPNFIFDVTKNISTSTPKYFLEQNDFQFAARYKYDSNEMSALGPISVCYKAEPNISTYSISKTITNKPLYTKELDLYVRVGNSGVFRRINTFDISDDIYKTSTVLNEGQVKEGDGELTSSVTNDTSDGTNGTYTGIVGVTSGFETNSTKGSGLEINVEIDGNAVGKITVNVGGKRYASGETITIKDSVIGGTEDVIITLQASDIDETFTWSGQTYEAIDITISSKLFDNVPVETKAIEVADNRIFLANNQDDYVNDATGDITIHVPSDTGYVIPVSSSGSIKNYFSAGSSSLAQDAGINSTEDGTTHYKTFANNSEYAVGYAFYDEAMKTRGIEKSTTFQTSDFDYPIIPTVSLTLSKSAEECFPSWAKYLQVLYTKNLNKTFFYEGFASAFWFELQEEGLADPLFTGQTRSTFDTRRVLKLNVTDSDLKNIENLVISLMGMFRDEQPYNYQEGDRIRINLVSSSGASNNILDMRIKGQAGALLYVEYTGGAVDLQNAFSYPEKNFFEIYTPKEIAEEENLIFYESGTLLTKEDFSNNAKTYNISQRSGVSGGGSSNFNSQQPLGDSIFQKLNLLKYSEGPFKNTTTVAGSESAANQTVTIRNSGQDIDFLFYTSATTQSQISGPNFTGNFLTFVAGSDLAERSTHTFANDSLTFNNTYHKDDNDSSDTVKLMGGKLRISLTVSGSGVLSSILVVPTITLFHVDSDGTETAIGTPYTTNFTNSGGNIAANTTINHDINFGSSNHTFGNLSASGINKTIDHDDKLRIKVTSLISWTTSASCNVTAVINTSADPIQLQVIGDYREVTTSIVFDNDAGVEDGGNFVVRTTSKAKRKIEWNTSSGKPLSRSIEKRIQRKINNIRYGGKFIQGTNINDISSFFILDRSDVSHENGAIQVLQKTSKLQAEGQVMLCICENETSSIYLNERILSDGAGNTLVAQAGKVLGTIRNLKGSYGTAHRKSVSQYKGNVFWWDSKSKKVIRYNRNGLTPISDIGMKKYFYNRTEAPVGYILPVYDMFVIDFGANKAIGFNNRNNRWVSTYNGQVELALHVDDVIYYFKGGTVTKSSSSNYDTYVDGSSSAAHLQFRLNSNFPVALENITVAQTGGDFVDYSQTNNIKNGVLQIDIENENGQNTVLYDTNFMLDSRYLFAHVMRDTGSNGGILNGDFMIGSNNKIKLTIKDSNDTTNDYKINAISVGYNNSAGHRL